MSQRYIFVCTWPSCQYIHKTKILIFRITRSIHRTRPRIPANAHQYTTKTLHPRENNRIILLYAGLREYMEVRSKFLHFLQALTLPASTESRSTRLSQLIFYGNQDVQKMSTKIMNLQNQALNAKIDAHNLYEKINF